MNDLWWIVAAILIAGAVGGVVNALTTDNGFILPKTVHSGELTILRIGALGNIIIGAVAAAASWGLYGPVKDFVIIGPRPENQASGTVLSVSTLFAALVIGAGGARWLTNEVDKQLLRAAASQAAGSQSNDAAAVKIAMASPASALEIAKAMPKA